ncbi:c-type cytochrome [Christiangramia flava]|uniref:Copper-containing nitrite reductase n=1 Tax=Christiangramia flava JLT2011 TaxID=1229726 RepID=A0A1L7I713_9FLAO|nr:cytochrome c [Christiangramia flava]APU69398.1 Copper-containing nitrite reductase [Christiangramia flava JLT2011]OSS37721.1 Copper-containing nitrite reductase [Christiangramia flava JLT2011]
MKRTILLLGLIGLISCKSDKKEEASSEEESYTIPAKTEAKNQVDPELAASIKRGKEVYSDLCVTCHLPTGKGIPGTYPPLDGSNWLTEKREESIRGVKYGLQGEIEVNGEIYDNVMTPMGLSDQEVADALNYAMNSWSNKITDMVTEEEVSKIQPE